MGLDQSRRDQEQPNQNSEGAMDFKEQVLGFDLTCKQNHLGSQW